MSEPEIQRTEQNITVTFRERIDQWEYSVSVTMPVSHGVNTAIFAAERARDRWGKGTQEDANGGT